MWYTHQGLWKYGPEDLMGELWVMQASKLLEQLLDPLKLIELSWQHSYEESKCL